MREPKVSVVLSVKNGMPYLPEAVDSILGQNFNNFEFLLLNNASCDDTRAYMETLVDPRVRCIYNEQDLGIAGSRNKAFHLARAPYVAPMDADDISLPHRLGLQVQLMESNPSVLASGGQFIAHETNIVSELPQTHEEIACRLLFISAIAHPASIVRKDAALRIAQGYSLELTPVEDYALWARLLMSGQGRLANLPDVLLRYRVHPDKDRTAYHAHMVQQANKVRAELYRWFWGADIDEERLRLHCMAGGDAITSRLDVYKILKYLDLILEHNAKIKIFSPEFLLKQLGEMFQPLYFALGNLRLQRMLCCIPLLAHKYDFYSYGTILKLIKKDLCSICGIK